MIKSPLAGWLGGKFQLAKRIIALIPEHTCYVEPFAGAAWVLFRKPQSEVEVINDINLDVVTLYRVVKHHLTEFIRYLHWILPARKEYERFMKENPETLTDIQRAVRFFFLQKNSFGGRIHGGNYGYATTKRPRLNLPRIEHELSDAYLRLCEVFIECKPYYDIIKRYDRPHTFFYIDPPYWDCEEDYGEGIFAKEDFTKLANILANIQGKFLLSINDRPEIRELFKQFIIEPVTVTYSSSGQKTLGKELLIRNYDL